LHQAGDNGLLAAGERVHGPERGGGHSRR
jgi:hypothetical protein